MPETQRPETVEQMCAQQIVRRAAKMAEQLRSTAERIEMEASRVERIGERRVSSYASIAWSIQNELRGMLGNLMFDQLPTDAYDADAARIKRLTAEAIASTLDAKEAAARTVADALPADSYAAGAANDRVSAINGCAWLAREYAKEG